ncbi:DUF654-domain-containing protein [Amniculicola lignicola CBS 123094]|uniref:DUF654-domain-containing protein n=1 Tax=Amniculicola lignicola CBS 123094 TaxID=1392246 RepID=A0A6A5X0I4_9PLEO|nr:DUF654-domain-containing protein [Amniculicola lignicola CBS 123094]
MSTRALRRAQKELEERQQLEQLQHEEAESDEETTPAPKTHASLFALLGDNGDADEEEHVDSEADNPDTTEVARPPPTASKKSKRKKKKKGKAKIAKPDNAPTSTPPPSGLDDIDRALLALDLTRNKSATESAHLTSAISEELQHVYSVLSIDPQHLQAANEMRKLFGRSAVQNDNNDDEPRARARGHGHQVAGVAAAIAQRGVGPRNLSTIQRRNIFIPGKEEWPQAPSGGLGMELVGRRENGTAEYRFVHSSAYQSIQKQFMTCVASMDPERMIQLLHYNPYHISTLLQVSEIAKQQRDNASAGDFLERALFSFGRAVHSTFKDSLSQGKARLDFRRPENREFWLAAWRYVAQLGVRATWRTAFEWAKLLLSLAPEEDPYCMRLGIDQLALRGREPQALIELVESDHLQRTWKIPPNLAFSVAIAYDRVKNPEKARSSLRLAIKEYPWIAARLCKDLEINPTPKAIWGKEPNGDHQELLCELYVPRAKDLWNTTEATSLLVEVASSFDQLEAGEDPYWLANIDEVDLARHVILSDDRALLSLVDPRIKNQYTSTSDPLPPQNNKPSYILSASTASRSSPLSEAQIRDELVILREYFNNIDVTRQFIANQDMTEHQLLQLLREAGTTYEEFRRNTERVQELRERMQESGLEVVAESDSDE